ncbi:histidine N-acetyltransferase-like [Mercenaria mercenaria]|uniref:histidine N-acetyltransferase-like n=1 Tax=Mercenaria mercenaria TaxID=6596 RepID=UPI00234EE9AC|nr:histidine N-acetyltransferase-like [Mercenaria mercenaria]
MSEFIVREATFDDLDVILNLSDFNEGLDYLHEYFDFFQYCSNVSSYVCETRNQIVGFVVCHRVDNGETILTRASRVRPEFQGKGVYRQMLMEIEEVQKEKGTARRYAVVKTRPPAMTQFQTYTSVARKEAHVFEIAEKQHVETSISDIKRIDGSLQKLEGIPALYLSEPYSNYLFPEGRIIVDLVPMRLIESNLKLAQGGNTVFVSDVQISSNEYKKLNTFDTPQVKGILTASSVYCTRDFAEMVLILDVFGSDLSTFNNHVAFHLKRLRESTPQQVHFKIYTSKGCDCSVIDYTLAQFGIKKLTEGRRLEDCVKLEVYERDLP